VHHVSPRRTTSHTPTPTPSCSISISLSLSLLLLRRSRTGVPLGLISRLLLSLSFLSFHRPSPFAPCFYTVFESMIIAKTVTFPRSSWQLTRSLFLHQWLHRRRRLNHSRLRRARLHRRTRIMRQRRSIHRPTSTAAPAAAMSRRRRRCCIHIAVQGFERVRGACEKPAQLVLLGSQQAILKCRFQVFGMVVEVALVVLS
jgi:hypothetical protein